MRAAEMFHALHARQYGFAMPDRPLELVNLRMRAVALQPKPVGCEWRIVCPPDMSGMTPRTTRLYLHGEWREVPVLWREELRPRQRIPAPALILQPDTTLLIEPGWHVELDAQGNLCGTLTH
jgi:N-methylhydantoinase A/oxoprolinase/acetone carboxylase beta subunit